jgi:tRNA(Ile)-lysidine synthase
VTIRARFERALDQLGPPLEPGPALVAVSGGSDSLALLDLLVGSARAQDLALMVLHVDHGIHPDSASIARRVEAAAARYRLGVMVERLGLGPAATETRAREARHRSFRQAIVITGARYLFLGHTLDDQVETLLMRWLRGSGPAGLAGMVKQRGRVIRPLLDFSRAELATHVASQGLEPWNDPANQDPIHLRAWIRHRLLPAVDQRFPRLRDELVAAQPEFEEQRAALEQLLDRLDLDLEPEPGGYSVAGQKLQGYSSAVVRTLLRALGRRCDLALGRAEVDRLQTLLAQGSSGQRVDLKQGAFAELSFGRLRLIGPVKHPTPEDLELDGPAGEAVFGRWRVRWHPDQGPENGIPRSGAVTWVARSHAVRVRRWRPGDRIRPVRGRGSRLVVRCMQDARVPRSRRPEWPVLEVDGAVFWVPDVCRSDLYLPEPGAPAMRIDVSSS